MNTECWTCLDIFVEADRLVDFARFFTHSGTKEVHSREHWRQAPAVAGQPIRAACVLLLSLALDDCTP